MSEYLAKAYLQRAIQHLTARIQRMQLNNISELYDICDAINLLALTLRNL
jgi:hypothetical protein